MEQQGKTYLEVLKRNLRRDCQEVNVSGIMNLVRDSCAKEGIHPYLLTQGANVVARIDQLFDTKDVKVLDIGCGSRCSPDRAKNGQKYNSFEPFSTRMIALAGIDTYGIDISPSWNEPYTHIAADLMEKSLEECVPKGTLFDVVTTEHFLNSPSLWARSDFSEETFARSLASQIHRVLQPSGRLISCGVNGFRVADYNTTDRILNNSGFICEIPAYERLRIDGKKIIRDGYSVWRKE